MRTHMKTNINVFRVLFMILMVTIIVYFSGSVWQVSPGNKLFNFILLIVSLLSITYTIVKYNIIIKKIDIKIITFLYFLFVIAITYIANYQYENINYYISFFSMVSLAFSITFLVEKEVFFKYYRNILLIIAIISLVYYFILNFTEINLDLIRIISNNGITYFRGFIFFSLNDPIRNIGVFWEPGVYASFLIFGILIQIVWYKKMFNISNIIFVLALLTTQSTAGYTLLILLVIVYVIEKLRRRKLELILPIVFFIIVVVLNIVHPVGYQFTQNSIFEKLFLLDFNNIRFQSIFFSFDIFINKPLFGSGFVFVNEFTANANIVIGNERLMQTSTSAYYLASAGLIGLFYTVIWIVSIFMITNISNITKILLAIITLSILNKEVHATILVTYIFLFYFLTKDKKVITYDENNI